MDGGEIAIHNSPFRDVADRIIYEVTTRQPRAGRAIFFLDQTGFAQVEIALISRIFGALPKAEVILTLATGSLINHLAETPALIKAVSPLELSEPEIQELIRYRDGDGGRALVQRTFREKIRGLTGATFDTPFFIRPRQSRRPLWFLHLSRHPTARDVMIQRHWEFSNTFEHYGTGGFGMLGWDSLRDIETLSLFRFGQMESLQLHDQLLEALPREIYALASENFVSVESVRLMVANETAARFSDLDKVMIQLALEKEIEIRRSDGKPRSRSIRRLEPHDLIAFPQELKFPVMSRLGDLRQ